jgi:hypothetical protein
VAHPDARDGTAPKRRLTTTMADSKEINLKTCSSCKSPMSTEEMTKTQSGNEIQGSSEQFRCRPCGQVISRIQRRKYTEEQKRLIRELSPSSRGQMMKQTQSLFGADLDKKVFETTMQSRLRKQATVFAAQGDYHDIEGPDGVKETMKHKPGDLENLLKNGRRFVCPVFQKEQIWVPKYHMKMTDESVDTEERKRKVEAEFTVKKAKKEKIPRAIKQEAEGETDGLPPPPAPLAEGQIKRLQKAIPKLEDLHLNFVTVLGTCTAPDNRGLVGDRAMEKAEKELKALQTFVQKCKTMEQEKVAPRGSMPAFFKELVDTLTQAQKTHDFMKNSLEMA